MGIRGLAAAALLVVLAAASVASGLGAWGTPVGVSSVEELGWVSPVPAGAVLLHVAPYRVEGGVVYSVLVFYDAGGGVSAVVNASLGGGVVALGDPVLVEGRVLQPLVLPDGSVVAVVYSGGSYSVVSLDFAGGRGSVGCVFEPAWGEPGYSLLVSDDGGLVLVAVEASGGDRRVAVYRLAGDGYCPVGDPVVLPVSWRIGGDGDVVVWLGEEYRLPGGSWYRGVTLPAVERVDSTGEIVVGVYSLVPEPDAGVVRVKHGVFRLNGSLLWEDEYVFAGATWGRMYGESLSSWAAWEASSTLVIALHDEEAHNRFIAVAGALGLLSVVENDAGFWVSTGASAGRLGLFYAIDEAEVYDSAGGVHTLEVPTYSAVLRASRLPGDSVLLAVQAREDSTYYDVDFYLLETTRGLWDTETVLEENWFQAEGAAPPEATTTTTTTAGEATATTTTTTTATTTATTRTTTTREAATTGETGAAATTTSPAGAAVPLRPGDWARYEGYIEYQGERVEFTLEIEVARVGGDGVSIVVKSVSFRKGALEQVLPLQEGLEIEYRAGEPPRCAGFGLDIFSFWADPSRLPGDGVVEGEGYRCVYDTRTGLLTEYYASYEFLGARQTISYRLVESSVEGLGGGGGVPLALVAAAAAAAIVAVAALLLLRRRG